MRGGKKKVTPRTLRKYVFRKTRTHLWMPVLSRASKMVHRLFVIYARQKSYTGKLCNVTYSKVLLCFYRQGENPGSFGRSSRGPAVTSRAAVVQISRGLKFLSISIIITFSALIQTLPLRFPGFSLR